MRYGALILALLCLVADASATSYPLQLGPNGRKILDADGKAVFFTADSPWHVINRLTREEAIQYLNNRQAKGFNALLISLIVTDGYSIPSPDNAYGDPPFTTPDDFSTPNEAYFAHADWFMQEAEARGITLFITPCYIGFNCNNSGWCDQMRDAGPTVLRDFGRYVGARYRDQPNIVWVGGGDANAGEHNAMHLVDAVQDGILDEDPNHLHTGHGQRFNSAIEVYNRPWLDFNTTYSDCDRTPGHVKEDYERSPAMPFVYIEGRYELESDWTPECIRGQAYWALLGGAMGQFYGNGPMWDFTSGWQENLGSGGSEWMSHFRDLLRSRKWNRLEPDYDHEVVTSGFGNLFDGSYAAAAKTTDDNTLIVYVPTQRTLTIQLNQMAGQTVLAWWFNPESGTSQFAGWFVTSGARQFTPPSNADWVLVIDNTASNYPAPGTEDIFVPVVRRSWGDLRIRYGN